MAGYLPCRARVSAGVGDATLMCVCRLSTMSNIKVVLWVTVTNSDKRNENIDQASCHYHARTRSTFNFRVRQENRFPDVFLHVLTTLSTTAAPSCRFVSYCRVTEPKAFQFVMCTPSCCFMYSCRMPMFRDIHTVLVQNR